MKNILKAACLIIVCLSVPQILMAEEAKNKNLTTVDRPPAGKKPAFQFIELPGGKMNVKYKTVDCKPGDKCDNGGGDGGKKIPTHDNISINGIAAVGRRGGLVGLGGSVSVGGKGEVEIGGEGLYAGTDKIKGDEKSVIGGGGYVLFRIYEGSTADLKVGPGAFALGVPGSGTGYALYGAKIAATFRLVDWFAVRLGGTAGIEQTGANKTGYGWLLDIEPVFMINF